MAEDQEFVLPPLEERPLVTFALFAYNQEKYIREAVEGAFAQTYEPLEIILSDDCSTDRTFEIMEEMANNYTGPHRVHLNKNSKNLGIGPHVSAIFDISKGDVIVMAAGDDISIPSRTSHIAFAAAQNPESMAFCSAYMAHESGILVKPDPPKTIEELFSRKKWILGATAAYRRRLYEEYGQLQEDVRNEDAVFALRALLSGTIFSIKKEALVLYRQNSGLSAQAKKNDITKEYRKASITELTYRRGLTRQWRRDLRTSKNNISTSSFYPYRISSSLLFALQKRKRIPLTLIKLHIRYFGIKHTLYEYLGNKNPALLNSYLRLRYWSTTLE